MLERLRLLAAVLVALVATAGLAARAAAAEFVAGSYPAAISGVQVEANLQFLTVATELECETADLEGELGEASGALALTATTGECSTGEGIVIMVPDMNECTYVLSVPGELGGDEGSAAIEIKCPEGNEVVWESTNTGCTLRTPPQTIESGLRVVDTTTSEPAKSVALITEAEGQEIKYTLEHGNECLGFPESGEYTNGAYTGQVVLSGVDAETLEAVDLTVK